jgi:hypothetical protein
VESNALEVYIALAVASDLSGVGGVGGEGEDARRERKARSNGIVYSHWQVGTHGGFCSVRRPYSVSCVVITGS